MNKKEVDLTRARITLIRILFGIGIMAYFAGKIVNILYIETGLLLIIIGLCIVMAMDKFKDDAQGIIDG